MRNQVALDCRCQPKFRSRLHMRRQGVDIKILVRGKESEDKSKRLWNCNSKYFHPEIFLD
jgi:hypothetical protein